jgi:hypothetical protein
MTLRSGVWGGTGKDVGKVCSLAEVNLASDRANDEYEAQLRTGQWLATDAGQIQEGYIVSECLSSCTLARKLLSIHRVGASGTMAAPKR